MRSRLVLPVCVLAAQLACIDRAEDAGDTDAATDTDAYRPSDTGGDTAAFGLLQVDIVDQPFQVAEGDTVVVTGRVHLDGVDVADVTLKLVSSIDGELPAPALDASGRFTATLDGLSSGVHGLVFTATDVTTHERGHAEARVAVCLYPPAQTFDTNPIGGDWQAFGDASWDPRGWMEITGNVQSRAGSIYLTDHEIDPGDFRLEFRIATGGGINTGADGYAVNIVDVPTLEDLATYVNTASNGGCLGYGVTNGCRNPGMVVDSFHVEFDTWQNVNDPITDPTAQDHVAITFDGDPGNHVLWAPLFLEDLQWRAVVVEAQGERLRVQVDGATIIDQVVAGFHFDGGWIGVSGSTGWATNEHRFDDLRILDHCEVPD